MVRFRFERYFGVVLVALTLLLAPAKPAQASILDCFKALVPAEQAAKATELAAKAGGCLSVASGDPFMAMTIAGMMTAAIAGEFSTIAECKAKIDSTVGQLIAEALLGLPPELLPPGAGDLLRKFVEGRTPLSFGEIIAGVLPQVTGYIECGCNVAGAPGEFAKLAEDYANTVEDCFNFFGDVADTLLQAGEDLGEAIHQALHPGSPGLAPQVPCPPLYELEVPPEIWTKKRIIPQLNLPSCYTGAICPERYLVVEKQDPPGSGQTWYKCSARCPDPVQSSFDDACYVLDTWMAVSGRCAPGQDIRCCEEKGQKVVKWGVCGPACPPDAIFDTQSGACSECPENSIPHYDQSGVSSVGRCEKCPPGLTSVVAAGQCTPCPPGQIMWNFDDPAAPKPPGYMARPGLPKPSGYAKAPGAPKPSGLVQSPLSPGQLLAGLTGKCVPCPPNWIPKYDSDPAQNSFGHCEECPPGTSIGPRMSDLTLPAALRAEAQRLCRPLECPGGIDPKNPHLCLPTFQATPVIPGGPPRTLQATPETPGILLVPTGPGQKKCPRGTRLVDGSCVTPTSARTPGSSLTCPPGQKPNASRTACIADGNVSTGFRAQSKLLKSQTITPLKSTPPLKAKPALRSKTPGIGPW